MRQHHFGFSYFIKNISTAIGIVLIWRGIWIIFDQFDIWFFGSNHIATAILGVLLGVIILYIPEQNLKALERL